VTVAAVTAKMEGGSPVPRRRLIFGVILALLLGAMVPPSATAAPPGFKTSQPPAAVALVPNVTIDPLLTAGDVVGAYQASGTMDGLGFYRSSNSSIELLIDHELANKVRDPVNATDNFDARVSHLTLSNPGRISAAEYALDGSEGFIWFCSGNLTVLDGTPWFFTGEEDQNYFSPHGGTTIAIDATDPSTYRVLNHFGYMAHEQELPILGLDGATFLLPEDNPGTVFAGTTTPNISQLYSYTASDWGSAIDGTGQLGVFVPDGTFSDGNPSTNDIHKGETLTGHFAPLDQATDNANQQALEAAAQAAGAFDFVRLEDVTQSRTQPGVAYFADTGRIGRETVRGRVYQLALDPADPTQAKLSVLLDGDAGDPIINPDNLAASSKALIIQEDRNAEHRFAAGVGSSLLKPGESPYSLMYVYTFGNGKLRAVARPDTLASLIPARGQGDWESSGITDASSLWGKGWWLFDVQMHHTSVGQPDTATLTPNATTGESAQLLRVYIPGT
jgi:hypothetical protein